jgi:dihydroflavonol-4-reductase
MFGPYDSKPGSGTLILGIYHRKIPGGGTGGRNYAFVKDVAVGIANALERGEVGQCYILGNQNLNYKELFAKISQVTGKAVSNRHFPPWMGKTVGLAGSIYGHVFKRMPALTYTLVKLALAEHYYCARKAVDKLDMPQTPIETAIEEALNWFRENGYLDPSFLKEKVQRRGST